MAAHVEEQETFEAEFDLTMLYQSLCTTLKGFVVSKHTFGAQSCFILTHEKLFDHPPFGPTSRVRIIIKVKEYVVHVF